MSDLKTHLVAVLAAALLTGVTFLQVASVPADSASVTLVRLA